MVLQVVMLIDLGFMRPDEPGHASVWKHFSQARTSSIFPSSSTSSQPTPLSPPPNPQRQPNKKIALPPSCGFEAHQKTENGFFVPSDAEENAITQKNCDSSDDEFFTVSEAMQCISHVLASFLFLGTKEDLRVGFRLFDSSSAASTRSVSSGSSRSRAQGNALEIYSHELLLDFYRKLGVAVNKSRDKIAANFSEPRPTISEELTKSNFFATAEHEVFRADLIHKEAANALTDVEWMRESFGLFSPPRSSKVKSKDNHIFLLSPSVMLCTSDTSSLPPPTADGNSLRCLSSSGERTRRTHAALIRRCNKQHIELHCIGIPRLDSKIFQKDALHSLFSEEPQLRFTPLSPCILGKIFVAAADLLPLTHSHTPRNALLASSSASHNQHFRQSPRAVWLGVLDYSQVNSEVKEDDRGSLTARILPSRARSGSARGRGRGSKKRGVRSHDRSAGGKSQKRGKTESGASDFSNVVIVADFENFDYFTTGRKLEQSPKRKRRKGSTLTKNREYPASPHKLKVLAKLSTSRIHHHHILTRALPLPLLSTPICQKSLFSPARTSKSESKQNRTKAPCSNDAENGLHLHSLSGSDGLRRDVEQYAWPVKSSITGESIETPTLYCIAAGGKNLEELNNFREKQQNVLGSVSRRSFVDEEEIDEEDQLEKWEESSSSAKFEAMISTLYSTHKCLLVALDLDLPTTNEELVTVPVTALLLPAMPGVAIIKPISTAELLGALECVRQPHDESAPHARVVRKSTDGAQPTSIGSMWDRCATNHDTQLPLQFVSLVSAPASNPSGTRLLVADGIDEITREMPVGATALELQIRNNGIIVSGFPPQDPEIKRKLEIACRLNENVAGSLFAAINSEPNLRDQLDEGYRRLGFECRNSACPPSLAASSPRAFRRHTSSSAPAASRTLSGLSAATLGSLSSSSSNAAKSAFAPVSPLSFQSTISSRSLNSSRTSHSSSQPSKRHNAASNMMGRAAAAPLLRGKSRSRRQLVAATVSSAATAAAVAKAALSSSQSNSGKDEKKSVVEWGVEQKPTFVAKLENTEKAKEDSEASIFCWLDEKYKSELTSTKDNNEGIWKWSRGNHLLDDHIPAALKRLKQIYFSSTTSSAFLESKQQLDKALKNLRSWLKSNLLMSYHDLVAKYAAASSISQKESLALKKREMYFQALLRLFVCNDPLRKANYGELCKMLVGLSFGTKIEQILRRSIFPRFRESHPQTLAALGQKFEVTLSGTESKISDGSKNAEAGERGKDKINQDGKRKRSRRQQFEPKSRVSMPRATKKRKKLGGKKGSSNVLARSSSSSTISSQLKNIPMERLSHFTSGMGNMSSLFREVYFSSSTSSAAGSVGSRNRVHVDDAGSMSSTRKLSFNSPNQKSKTRSSYLAPPAPSFSKASPRRSPRLVQSDTSILVLESPQKSTHDNRRKDSAPLFASSSSLFAPTSLTKGVNSRNDPRRRSLRIQESPARKESFSIGETPSKSKRV